MNEGVVFALGVLCGIGGVVGVLNEIDEIYIPEGIRVPCLLFAVVDAMGIAYLLGKGLHYLLSLIYS